MERIEKIESIEKIKDFKIEQRSFKKVQSSLTVVL